RFTARWELFFIALVPTFLIYWFNWNSAWKNGLRLINESSGEDVKFNASKWVIIVVAALLAIVNALNAMGSWGTFLQFMNPTPFGESDPLFGLDVGFYVFTLPFIKYIQSWLQGVLVVTLLGTFTSYFMTRSLSLDGTKLTTSSRARLHMSLLGALLLLLWGAGYWLARYDLLFSPTGVVFGAGYTDINILLPAYKILTAAAVAAAVLLLMNFYKPMWKMSAILIGALLLLGWVARSFVPGLVQQYRVKPNEYELEKPFLDYHLDYTRKAFDLNDVKTISVTPEDEVTPEELLADQDTVRNIRLWDYAPLLRTYKQLQAIRTYYDFNDVYIDRYMINGTNRQVMLSVRELDLSKLQNQTWVNMHLEFTHGYGVVMNPVNEVAPGGLPAFFIKDLPPRSTVEIKLDKPQIYYGSMSMENSYVLVNTDVKEFDYPMGDSNVRSTYEGNGGVDIGSFWKKLLFALRFRDTEILFTGALRPESRVLYYRNAREALNEITPFLIFDQDTYPVIFDGRIIWVQD
ncbi:MAG: COG1615 family transporter, partial [Synergistaceae bacterium]|nr:COG1615 family transporter [Synergistaceae bacterium]